MTFDVTGLDNDLLLKRVKPSFEQILTHTLTVLITKSFDDIRNKLQFRPQPNESTVRLSASYLVVFIQKETSNWVIKLLPFYIDYQ